MRITDRRVAIVLPSAPPEPVYMKMGILRHEEMNCLWPASRLLTQLRKARPDILRGYPGALAWLADHLDDSDRELICPRFSTADSETLTPNMRDRIRAGFKARVFDFYDSHEFNVIAWECPVSGLYHVCDSSVLAEVLDGDRPAAFNEEGEFVGTALHSWAMPFIRMRLGDLVTRGPERCSCGRRGSILARVQGRLLDRFLLPGGESMHPCALLAPLYRSAPWLRQFQIVQQASGKIQVKLVPLGPSQPPEDLAAVSRALSEAIGGQLQVEAELVSRILPEANGKFRPFCTKVAEGS
jgi:phenylacetate-CoA ligase